VKLPPPRWERAEARKRIADMMIAAAKRKPADLRPQRRPDDFGRERGEFAGFEAFLPGACARAANGLDAMNSRLYPCKQRWFSAAEREMQAEAFAHP
jgi:hypothetical protein